MSNGQPNQKNRPTSHKATPQFKAASHRAMGSKPAPKMSQPAKPQPKRPEVEEPEEILIKDANGQFKVLKRGELEEVAVRTSRELIDKIQEEIIETLEKKKAVEPIDEGKKGGDVFNQEEESKDVKKVAASMAQATPAKPVEAVNFDKLADEVIRDSGVTLKDPILLNRLRIIVVTQLRNVRKLLDTRMILIKSTQQGGMSFDNVQADKMVSSISKKMEIIGKQETKQRVLSDRGAAEFSKIKSTFAESETKPAPASQSVPMVQTQAMPAASQPPTRPLLPPPPANMPIISSEPAPMRSAMPTNAVPASSAMSPAKPSLEKPANAEREKPGVEIPVRDFTQISAASRPQEVEKITDIKVPYQLVGPIQDLRYSLTDFRRLAETPDRSASKIEEKIKLLEKEGFPKKTQGVRAWQASEVFQTYLALGLEALNKKISLDEAINQRRAANKPFVTKPEFEAVSILNQRLQY